MDLDEDSEKKKKKSSPTLWLCIQVYLKLELIMEVNTMSPDQTPLGAVRQTPLGVVWSGSKLFAIKAT